MSEIVRGKEKVKCQGVWLALNSDTLDTSNVSSTTRKQETEKRYSV